MNKWFPVGLLAVVFLQGCASFRGIPSHGGGKRFDEEQRLIAAATYQALSTMNTEALRGRKVQVTHQFMTTFGSGNANWGGLQNMNFSANYQDFVSDYLGGSRNTAVGEQRTGWSQTGSTGFRPDMTFFSSLANTDRDAAYFADCFQMKLRHEGIDVVLRGGDVMLYVFLDVFGTNLGRKDRLVQTVDTLTASCEFTYYAEEIETGALLFPAQREGAAAIYREYSYFLLGINTIQREVYSTIPLEMPLFYSRPESVPPSAPTAEPTAPAARLRKSKAITADPARPSAPGNNNTETPTRRLDDLGSQAIKLLEAGQTNEVTQIIQHMRSIDPSAEEIKEVNILLQKSR